MYGPMEGIRRVAIVKDLVEVNNYLELTIGMYPQRLWYLLQVTTGPIEYVMGSPLTQEEADA